MSKTLSGKILTASLLIAVVFCMTGTGHAPGYDDVTRERSEVSQMTHKLGRGIVNILTGWIEIPKTIADKWRETDPATGFVMGFIQGSGWAFCRTATGFYDTVSFPFPAPDDYLPLMEPEFILPSIWGDELPFQELEVVEDVG